MTDVQTELVRVSAGGDEPLTLDDAKLWLRVETGDDDALIGALITAAREYAETFCRRAFTTGEQYRYTLDRFPYTSLRDSNYVSAPLSELYLTEELYLLQRSSMLALEIPESPLASVDAITYTDPTGQTQTLDPSLYTILQGDDTLARLFPVYPNGWPSTRLYPGAVQVLFTTGGTAPQGVILALKQLIAHWYANREAYVMQPGIAPQQVPLAAEMLLWPHRNLEF